MILKNNFDQDAKYNCKFDLDSPIDTPKYLEGYQVYKNEEFNPNLHFIVEIKKVNIDWSGDIINSCIFETIGFTIIPLFSKDKTLY